MRIEIETNDMDRHDAIALVALVMAKYPDLEMPDGMGDPADMILAGEPADAAKVFRMGFTDADAAPEAAEVFAAAPPVVSPLAAPDPFVDGATGADGSTETATLAAAAASAAPSGVELDAEGLPWDARIHAKSKAKTVKNAWRTRRNLKAEDEVKVKAELRAALAAPAAPLAPSAAPPAPPSPGTSASAEPAPAASPAPMASSPSETPDASASSVSAVPPVPPAEAAPPPSPPAPPAPAAEPAPSAPAPDASPAPAAPATAAAPGGSTFIDMMKAVTAAQAAKQITQEDTAAIVGSLGLASIRDFLTRGDLIPSFMATFNAYIGAGA